MTTAAPTRADELAEVLGENGPVLDDKAQAAIKAYVDSQIQSGIGNRISEGVQAGLAEFYKTQNDIDGARPNVAAAAPDPAKARNPLYNARAAGAKLDGKFGSVTDMLLGLRDEAAGTGSEAARLVSKLRNDFSSTTPSEGGFLVPEEYRAEMMRVGLETSVVRANGARVIPMSAPRVSFPTVDTTTNVGSVFGGVIAYWTAEAAQLTASSPTFGRVTLDTNKLTAYAEIPNELLEDSAPSVEPLAGQIYPEAMTWYEDRGFISGNGVGQPLGYQNADCMVTVAKESSQAAATVLWANIVKMYSRMLPTSLGRAVWVINQTVLVQLLQMTLPVKNVAGTENVGGSVVGIAYDQGTGRPMMTLLGRPIVVTEKVPALGTAGDITFVDFGYYLIGDRQQLVAAKSEHFKFNEDTTAYRWVQRLDGRPWLQDEITPANGDTLSPFVNLATRA